MALIGRNRDGTYTSACALCGDTLAEPIFATSHFIGDRSHDLYRFSDTAMHWSCYVRWPEQARFASMFFDAAVLRSETNPWPQYWPVLMRTADELVLYGLVVDEISIILRKSGTDIRIKRDKWQGWLSGKWREECRPGLECDAVAGVIPELAQLSLPKPIGPENGVRGSTENQSLAPRTWPAPN